MNKTVPIGFIVLSFGLMMGELFGPKSIAKKIDPMIILATNQREKTIPSFFVKHETNGSQVFVECMLTGISFREKEDTNQKVGKLVIWVDGKIKSEAAAAAFIIKGLTPGNHKVKLEVVSLRNEPYGLTKEFMVNIRK